MIPSDLAARLRLLNEASFFNTDPPVAGLQRAREIQAQLPDLVPGQRFFATLQRTLPDGTFRAIVDWLVGILKGSGGLMIAVIALIVAVISLLSGRSKPRERAGLRHRVRFPGASV